MEFTTTQNILIHVFFCWAIFFTIYMTLYKINPENFAAARSNSDILYFSFTTQSTIGNGDIIPTTTISRLMVSLHCIFLIVIAANFIKK